MLNISETKTGSEFVTSSDLKISGFDRRHDSKFFPYSKISTLESGFKKLWIRIPDCWIRLDRRRIRKEKVTDSKISDMYGRGPSFRFAIVLLDSTFGRKQK